MMKTICPYCGGRCETTGGPDGNPFNKDRKEKTVCTACGRTISESDPLRIPENELCELMSDTDTLDAFLLQIEDNPKCWKITDNSADGAVITIGDNHYTQQTATDMEMVDGELCLAEWVVEREYMVQSCGPDSPRAYCDWRSEMLEIPFEELVFCDGECIGICHNECVMLFDDESTHRRKKWLGEIITGPDMGIDVYDYYNLKKLNS